MNEHFDRAIKTSIERMSNQYNADTIYLVTAKVISVDINKGVCSVEAVSGNAVTTIENVEFQAVIADGIDIIPAIDSEVKVLYTKYTNPFIVQYSEVDKMYLAANLVQFNDGNLGGMVKVIDLTQKLNNLENKVNSIISTFNTHTHTSAPPGSPTTPPTSPISGTLTPTQQSDIEDTIITH